MPKLKEWITQAQKVEQQVAQPAQSSAEASSSAHQQPVNPELQQQISRLQKAFADRVTAHGQRLFRHPDGILRNHKPDANPYTLASRGGWSEVVKHCQVTGGDPEFSRLGKSWRYGHGVPKEEHACLLSCIGLQAEAPVHDPQCADPLADPEHCLNTNLAENGALILCLPDRY